ERRGKTFVEELEHRRRWEWPHRGLNTGDGRVNIERNFLAHAAHPPFTSRSHVVGHAKWVFCRGDPCGRPMAGWFMCLPRIRLMAVAAGDRKGRPYKTNDQTRLIIATKPPPACLECTEFSDIAPCLLCNIA